MDRTTIRLILLVIGILVIAGVYFWPRIKPGIARLRSRERDDFTLDDDIVPIHIHTRSAEDDLFRAGNGRMVIEDELAFSDKWALRPPARKPSQPAAAPKSETAAHPEVVQLSVVAANNALFPGPDMLSAFRAAGLEYGEMGIYHRRDPETGGTLFSVASLVEPGAFPHEGMETFECPGVVLFYLPGRSADPLATFEAMVSTCHDLANRLNGVEWDAGHRPLTPETIRALRISLL